MAADKKQGTTIVIKKITVVAGGGHGGSWKVAFADFMTAMMAFFLVMWLVGQSEEVKKSVSDYFSTPSIIEYNFSNFGVQLTLEKLFLDLLNEPLKAFEQFIMPVDKTPNIMDMGMKKIQTHYLAEKLGEFAKDIQVTDDEITFEISADHIFKKDTATPSAHFVAIMENIRQIVEGLKDTDIYINAESPAKDPSRINQIRNVAEERLDLVMNKVEQGITDESVDIFGKTTVERVAPVEGKRDMNDYMKFRLRQKDSPKERVQKSNSAKSAQNAKSDSRAPAAAAPELHEDVYDTFVDKLTRKAEGLDKE